MTIEYDNLQNIFPWKLVTTGEDWWFDILDIEKCEKQHITYEELCKMIAEEEWGYDENIVVNP
jgi:hypothetical protein